MEYVRDELLAAVLDSQMMKESMITFMAQLMGNGKIKDNFFLKSRIAIQDTISLHYIVKSIGKN